MCSFVETKLFTRLVQEYVSDEAYRQLQAKLIKDPHVGKIIPGSGGVRKLRWQAPGRGKQGGSRVIYLPKPAEGIIWMLTIYSKNVADDIPVHILRKIRKEVEDG
jgi:hypothetical protein